MHTPSVLVAYVAILSAVVSAEVERPRYYFPRHVKRQIFRNTTSATTPKETTEDIFSSVPTTSAETTKRDLSDFFEGLTTGGLFDTSEPTKSTTPSSDGASTVVVTNTQASDESSNTPTTAGAGTVDEPTASLTTGIEFGPSGIIKPSSTATETTDEGLLPGLGGLLSQISTALVPTTTPAAESTNTEVISDGISGPSTGVSDQVSTTPTPLPTEPTVTISTELPAFTLPTEILPTEILPTEILPTEILPTEILPTSILPTEILPTEILPTSVLPTEILPTSVLPTEILPTEILPTTALPTEVLPTNPVTLPTDPVTIPTDPVTLPTDAPTITVPTDPITLPTGTGGQTTLPDPLPTGPSDSPTVTDPTTSPSGTDTPPITSPTDIITSPTDIITSPTDIVTSPTDIVTSPTDIVTSPTDIITSPTGTGGQTTITDPSPTGPSDSPTITVPTTAPTGTGGTITSDPSPTGPSDTPTLNPPTTTAEPTTQLPGSTNATLIEEPTVTSAAPITPTASDIPTNPPTISALPTGTATGTTWLPESLIYATSATLSAGATPSSEPTGIPSTLPQIIQAPEALNVAPDGMTKIQVGFKFALNWRFVASNSMSAAQIMEYLPMGLKHGLDLKEDQVKMQSLFPLDTSRQLGFITTVAHVYLSENMVDTLRLDLLIPASKIYNHEDPSVNQLMNYISISIPLQPGETLGGDAASGTGSGAAPTNKPDSGVFDTNAQNTSTSVKKNTIGMTVGIAGAAAAYGAAMFFIARRYKKRRQSHRRSSSVMSNSEMRQTGSPALMGGANPYMTGGRGSPINNRNSGGSGGTGQSARTQQISAPMMAENSLGWN